MTINSLSKRSYTFSVPSQNCLKKIINCCTLPLQFPKPDQTVKLKLSQTSKTSKAITIISYLSKFRSSVPDLSWLRRINGISRSLVASLSTMEVHSLNVFLTNSSRACKNKSPISFQFEVLKMA